MRDGSREIRPLPVAAAVAIAVALMAITIRAVAVGGIAVVAVRGMAVVAIPAAIPAVTIVAVAIGGSLGGGEAGCAERGGGGGGDRDEGLLGATNEDNMAQASTLEYWANPPFALEGSRPSSNQRLTLRDQDRQRGSTAVQSQRNPRIA